MLAVALAAVLYLKLCVDFNDILNGSIFVSATDPQTETATE